ncbi:MAG: TIGR02688 family protein [Pseudomonadales bacterium RIFCSPLOWO2_12_60_38]|jgi:ATP-dependent Lon protease|uniref:BREX system Lon protease-like protein BrxL n=3 Tax=Pseudomonas fluorescens group TaxID=136843 RepID=A0A7Y1MUN1_9PSED|nr:MULTISPECIES: BREX system Lon protease-like protein BrxL [Pseudomonas]OHC33149.1 MAG: TIGR02688 family protein [Pseudomonadales bacterium RIFCSPLOWO2_12_60_38]OHC42175.1 MAG: TIGR02688 family protein [Pseudomonadales bacterium RIFCSPLOWO2_12_FULL_59_450]ETK23199.1 alkaline phosphatase domain-containing protein [Pseudomonas sp. FH1]MBT9304432.1 BREX system Lon protease-like protein BrxL [Pseudomonas sp. TAE6080]MCF4981393.1 BREX system Lon protease-like protein BrxL [Pseudomonas gessardii]
MSQLDDKINQHFAGLVVRKDLVKAVKGNAIVPSYVLEYLLGQYCATNDEATIQTGIETVKEILRKHYVHRNEAGLVRSTIKEKGRHKVIDRISVSLNDKDDVYEAEFANLGIKKVLIDSNTVKTHQKLLVGGVWCIADVEYEYTEDKSASPWLLASLKPIQISRFDFDGYLEARKQFTTDEWIDLLIQSVGFNPQMFGKRNKLAQLIRLIPFCERNYNLIELGPKGTGKSHVYSEFSPHGILISGGEVTVPKLFVHNGTGKLGLVGYWDVVAFDEFAGKQKRVDKALVDIMKNYMANKSFSRGVETLGAEASMVFVGNTDHTVPYMLKHTDLFDPLPEKFHDSAFLDRIHSYIPGWEVDVIRGEMFSSGYGFVVDYLAEILRSLRSHDYSDRYKGQFTLSDDISTRDRDGINKTFSGLMKILYPHGETTDAEVEDVLRTAIEGRKRVKDQLLRIDATYPAVRFAYQGADAQERLVRTLEEDEYPDQYHRRGATEVSTADLPQVGTDPLPLIEAAPAMQGPASRPSNPVPMEPVLKEQHLVFHENQRGLSFDKLFSPYLVGAKRIIITDPYLRMFHQLRNLMELMETISKLQGPEDEVVVHVVTVEDDSNGDRQTESLQKIADACTGVGIQFSWAYDTSGTKHDRDITTDTGWKIVLGRGLDVFQRFELNDAFSFANRLQQHRQCKEFSVTFVRVGPAACS